MPQPVVIRRATRDDVEGLGRLGAVLVQEHHDFDARRFIEPGSRTPANYAAFLGSQLEEPEVIVLVAELEGRLVGYAYAAIDGIDYMSLRGPAGLLHDVIVDREHRGRGIGRRLVNAVLSNLASRGVRQVVLSTAEKNERAQRLFARLGFRRTMIEMTREFDEPEPAGE